MTPWIWETDNLSEEDIAKYHALLDKYCFKKIIYNLEGENT